MSISNIEIKNIDSLIKLRSQLIQNTLPIGLADTVIYYYIKDASFFSKKQQRIIFTFFQGLNTNPQNLSIFLRDKVAEMGKQSKQKLVKGQFIVYDIFNKNDCVIEISIPGNFQIYKIQKLKKQLISNKEIDMMYISSVIRAMYEKNLVWGKSYNLFGAKNMLEEFKGFLNVFFRIAQKNDIYISDDFQYKSAIKGSHICSIVFEYIKSKQIVKQTIELIEKQVSTRGGYTVAYPKMLFLLSELYNYDGKYAKSLSIVGSLLFKYENDPFILYYEAKYLLKLMVVHEALTIVNSIVQYHQFQIWSLAAQIHIELKNYSEALVCLNHASKMAGKAAKNIPKPIDPVYGQFEKLGKKNLLTTNDEITKRPKLMFPSQNPLSIIRNVEPQYKNIIENQYWRMGYGQKIVFNMVRHLKYKIESKKFQQLLENTFEQQRKQFLNVNFKNGMSQSMFIDVKRQETELKQETQFTVNYQQEQLPHFLKDQSIQMEIEEEIKGNRNLSVIPQLQSVIENSQFEEREKQAHKMKPIKQKKELNEQFYKIIKAVLAQDEIQKAQFEGNWAKVLPVYNQLRKSSKINSFYLYKMFEITMKIENYKFIIVLIAQTLDLYEQMGTKTIQVLPYWIQKYIFQIIQQKGLKFLTDLLEKMSFKDKAVINTIELAKNWKIKGCTF